MSSTRARVASPFVVPQLALFETPRAKRSPLDMLFVGARRVQLDQRSWVDHIPGWLAEREQLTDDLLQRAAWAQHDRWMFSRMIREPRLTGSYPVLAEAPFPRLHAIAAALSAHYGVLYDGLWLNQYRDHRDSTSWHGDWPSCKRDECVVPVLSLGATRRFLIRPREGGRSTAFTCAAGDLVVMGGRCQKDWVHAVPKQATPSGLRISVNFQSSAQAIRDK